jgi:hypothetical protein
MIDLSLFFLQLGLILLLPQLQGVELFLQVLVFAIEFADGPMLADELFILSQLALLEAAVLLLHLLQLGHEVGNVRVDLFSLELEFLDVLLAMVDLFLKAH